MGLPAAAPGRKPAGCEKHNAAGQLQPALDCCCVQPPFPVLPQRAHQDASHPPMPARLQVLGRGLALLPRDQIVVATKVGRYGSGFDFRCDPPSPLCLLDVPPSYLQPGMHTPLPHLTVCPPTAATHLQRRARDRQRARVPGPPAAHLRRPHPVS